MQKISNERHVEKFWMVSDLVILQELNRRLNLEEQLAEKLAILEAKETAWASLNEGLKKVNKDHWAYLTDLSFDYYNTINCDFTLITTARVYAFELVHFDGALAGNLPLNLKPVVLFAEVPGEIKVENVAVGLEIVPAKDLEDFLKQVVRVEEEYQGEPMLTPQHFTWFGKIDRHHLYLSLYVPNDMRRNLQKGMLCPQCDGTELEIRKPHVFCACGMKKTLEDAIVRTICEYGILYSD